MIATGLVITGILTGALGLLDIFLTKDQKDKADAYLLRIWNWLSDAKRVSLVGWLLNPSFRLWFVATAGGITALGAVAFLFHDGFSSERGALILMGIVAAAVMVGGGVGLVLIRLLLSRPTWAAPIWAIAFFCISSIVHVIIVFWGALEVLFTRLGVEFWEEPIDVWHFGSVLWLVYTVTVIQIFSLITTLPLLLVTIAQGLLFLAEFIARRIAESPKGVVMSISGIATAVGATLKAFA